MSRPRTSPRTAVTAIIVAAVLASGTGLAVAVAGHDGPAPVRIAASAGTSTTVPASSAASASGSPVPPAASSSATTSTHASGGPAPATSSPPATTTTTKPPPPSSPGPKTGSSGPPPAAPGTYRYRQVGTLPGTPAEGTLVVASASAPGTQTWARLVGGTIPPSTSVMLFNSAGSFLISPGGQVAGAAASCTFATPVPWPPWPASPGQTTSAQASCTGPVHSYQVTEQVQGTEATPLDGHPVNTTVVVTTIAIKGIVNGSPLTVTLTETDYYAATLRVPVLTRTHVVGTAIGIPITTDRTDTLESANPT